LPNNPTQRISPQRVLEIADALLRYWEHACPECRGYLGRSDIECLRQLAGQLERDARVIEAARQVVQDCSMCHSKGFVKLDDSADNAFEGSDSDPVKSCPSCTALRQALADLDRREETR